MLGTSESQRYHPSKTQVSEKALPKNVQELYIKIRDYSESKGTTDGIFNSLYNRDVHKTGQL